MSVFYEKKQGFQSQLFGGGVPDVLNHHMMEREIEIPGPVGFAGGFDAIKTLHRKGYVSMKNPSNPSEETQRHLLLESPFLDETDLLHEFLSQQKSLLTENKVPPNCR